MNFNPNDVLNDIYTAMVGLSFLSSLAAFRPGFSYPLKLFSVLLGITFGVECLALWLYSHHHSNVPLYNVFMLLEFWGYAYFFWLIMEPGGFRKIVGVYLWAFPPLWAVLVFVVFEWGQWNSYLAVAGSFFTICFSGAYYYQLINQEELVRLETAPEFWIATGLLLFYTCNLPYMGMLNFLVRNYLGLARSLLTVLDVLNILMYSLFIYAYLCRIIIKRS